MSEKIAFRNVSNKNHFFAEIKNRRITFENDKKINFTQEEIDSCEALRDTIRRGDFIPWAGEGEEMPEKSSPVVETSSYEARSSASSSPPPESSSSVFGDVASFGDLDNGQTDFSKFQKKEKTESSVQKIESSDITELWWAGPSNDMGGYGKMNRECLERLYCFNDLKIAHELAGLGGAEKARSKFKSSAAIKAMMDQKVSDDAISVWAIMPPKFLPRKSRKILFTMMECNRVPDGFVEKCKNADELWLPSLHNMQVFEESGVNIPKYHMPLGVDTNKYRPFDIKSVNKEKVSNIKTKSFVFMSLFGWSLRKGVDVLFRSYLEEFTSEDDVTLMVVSRLWGRSSQSDIEEIRSKIKEYIKRFAKNTEKPPNIVHVGQAVQEEDLPLLYNMSNAFVLPSRGEGFGLPYLEAGSCGLPVIGTRCTGQMDFLNDENSYLIDIEGYDSNSQEIKEIYKISSYYEGQPFAVIGESGTQQLKEHMRYVYENEEEAKKKAEILRERIQNEYTWDHLAKKIHDRIKENA